MSILDLWVVHYTAGLTVPTAQLGVSSPDLFSGSHGSSPKSISMLRPSCSPPWPALQALLSHPGEGHIAVLPFKPESLHHPHTSDLLNPAGPSLLRQCGSRAALAPFHSQSSPSGPLTPTVSHFNGCHFSQPSSVPTSTLSLSARAGFGKLKSSYAPACLVPLRGHPLLPRPLCLCRCPQPPSGHMGPLLVPSPGPGAPI